MKLHPYNGVMGGASNIFLPEGICRRIPPFLKSQLNKNLSALVCTRFGLVEFAVLSLYLCHTCSRMVLLGIQILNYIHFQAYPLILDLKHGASFLTLANLFYN